MRRVVPAGPAATWAIDSVAGLASPETGRFPSRWGLGWAGIVSLKYVVNIT